MTNILKQLEEQKITKVEINFLVELCANYRKGIKQVMPQHDQNIKNIKKHLDQECLDPSCNAKDQLKGFEKAKEKILINKKIVKGLHKKLKKFNEIL